MSKPLEPKDNSCGFPNFPYHLQFVYEHLYQMLHAHFVYSVWYCAKLAFAHKYHNKKYLFSSIVTMKFYCAPFIVVLPKILTMIHHKYQVAATHRLRFWLIFNERPILTWFKKIRTFPLSTPINVRKVHKCMYRW